MRLRRRIGLVDLPRLIIGGVMALAGLLGGRYQRIEGAHVLATDGEGRILAVRTTYLDSGWMLPGGRVERSETPHGAAVRETLEETGLQVRLDRLVFIDARRPKDVSFVFLGSVTGGDLAPQLGEIAEVGWLDRAEIEVTSPRLHRLLALIDAAGEGVGYWGLPRA